ncbi:MAG TPA: DUF1223 domain-containing protein [Kofleriaceae bacterium]|nr:DUF1223 domain-containing protein [Kofleriaceae bacterium]
MRTMLAFLLGFLPFACASAEGQAVPPSSAPAPAPAPAPSGGAEGPLVVELFTSQGCNSCPPADRHLATMAKAGQVSGRAVVPLSFHVDYWNDLGWTDPYSQAAWTERQQTYARALGDRVYTPELVVGGAAGMVGSHTQKIAAAIAAAPRPALLAATAAWATDHVEVTATAPADADVLVAVWEDARTIAVPRGENAGEKLTNHRIVRRLERIAAAGQRGTKRIALDPGWKGTGAVAFAQRADQRIIASALLPR